MESTIPPLNNPYNQMDMPKQEKNPKEKKSKYGKASSSCSLVLHHLNVLEVGTFLLWIEHQVTCTKPFCLNPDTNQGANDT
jgi:hypothetical protein